MKMKIKIHTLIKGVVWQLIGVVTLFIYASITIGDIAIASTISVGYPLLRAVLWYPYERIYKRIRRRNYLKECKQNDIYH